MENSEFENARKNGSDSAQQAGVGRSALALSLTVLLIQACASGDVAAVANLVSEQNADPFSKDESGRTPLGVACEAGQVQVAKYLIETEGVSPGFKGTNGSTPLHAAARGGHLDVVRYLVDDRGVDPSCKDRNQRTPLDSAKHSGVRDFLASRGAKGSQIQQFQPVALPNTTSLLSRGPERLQMQQHFQPVTLPNATSLLSKQHSRSQSEERRPSLVCVHRVFSSRVTSEFSLTLSRCCPMEKCQQRKHQSWT